MTGSLEDTIATAELKAAVPDPWHRTLRRRVRGTVHDARLWLRGGGCEPINWRCRIYSAWYRGTSRAMHRHGLHRWRRRPLGGRYCDWCGESRRD